MLFVLVLAHDQKNVIEQAHSIKIAGDKAFIRNNKWDEHSYPFNRKNIEILEDIKFKLFRVAMVCINCNDKTIAYTYIKFKDQTCLAYPYNMEKFLRESDGFEQSYISSIGCFEKFDKFLINKYPNNKKNKFDFSSNSYEIRDRKSVV